MKRTYPVRTRNVSKQNIRVIRNDVGVLYGGARKSKRLRGYDLLDHSREFAQSVRIANTYAKTEYVKYNNEIIKLKSLCARLKHAHIKYYINSDYTYITIQNGKSYTTHKISYTNACVVKHNHIDKTQYKKLYNK